jgi:hypothetical protein
MTHFFGWLWDGGLEAAVTPLSVLISRHFSFAAELASYAS